MQFLWSLICVLFLAACVPTLAGEGLAGDLLGRNTTDIVGPEDTLYDIARRNGLGISEVTAANRGLSVWKPPVGAEIAIAGAHILPPDPREGLVINLAEPRLYFFPPAGPPVTFPLSVGREGWETPLGQTRVIRKREKPTWYVPASIRAEHPELPETVPPGPENPLGNYAISLGMQGVLLHGTNQPRSIGRYASHGCMRLYPEHIEILFGMVEVGERVRIIDAPVKTGRRAGKLYLEVAPARPSGDTFSAEAARALIREAASDSVIDWETAEAALKARTGLPVRIEK